MRANHLQWGAGLVAVLGAAMLMWSASGSEVTQPTDVDDNDTTDESVVVAASVSSPAPAVVSASGVPMAPIQRPSTSAQPPRRFTDPHYRQRVSQFADVPPFDGAAFADDPDAYVTQVVPMRAYQSATPGPDVPVLGPLQAGVLRFQQGEPGEVGVRGLPPHAPVTFTALDGGIFMQSQRSSVSLRADADGCARVMFFAGVGVHDAAQIVVGSPLAVGPLTVHCYIITPHLGEES